MLIVVRENTAHFHTEWVVSYIYNNNHNNHNNHNHNNIIGTVSEKMALHYAMLGLNLLGYRTLEYRHESCTRSQNVYFIYHREMVWYIVLKIGSR